MNKLNQWIHKILNFLRITDEDGVLSLTNIFIIIVLFKLAMAPTLQLEEVATVFIAISNYMYKRHVNKGEDNGEDK